MKLFTTCLGYADLLAMTLPAWKRLGDVVVITVQQDHTTQELCRRHGVRFEVTGAWFINASTCNKGAAQHSIVHALARPGEPIVMFDADVYPVGPLPPFPGLPLEDIMLGCCRYNCKDSKEFMLRLGNSAYPLKEITTTSYCPELVRGYYQQFIFQSHLQFFNNRHRTFSGCDLHLARQFAVNYRVEPDVFHVLHLGKRGVNWHGRVTPQWK